MKQKNRIMTRLTLYSGITLVAATSAQAAVLTTSGDINTAANWDTGVLPGAGETATVNIDASWPATTVAQALLITGDLVFGGGSTLTASIDLVGEAPNSVTFNDVTVNVADDIFTGGAGGNFIFNDGSITNVGDDFEANAGGIITVNGGMHTLASLGTSNFGAQANSILNFLGGTVTGVDLLRTAGGTLNIGGDAMVIGNNGSTASFDPDSLNFNSNWSGSLELDGVTSWEDTLVNSGATLNEVVIDSASFATNFVVSGQTLSLAVPEPSSLSLLGLSALFLAGRRSRK